MSIHPSLRFVVTAVTFHEDVMGMKEQDGHLTHARKAEIIAEWTPRIGRAFDHTNQFPEGVQYRQVWLPTYEAGQEFKWVYECPDCIHRTAAVDNRRTAA